MPQETFPQFLERMLKERGLSGRQAGMQAGLDHAAISRFMNGTQPTVENCIKLADFFGVPRGVVLDLAGHDDMADQLEYESEDDLKTAIIREIEHLMSRLPESDQREIRDFIRIKLRNLESED